MTPFNKSETTFDDLFGIESQVDDTLPDGLQFDPKDSLKSFAEDDLKDDIDPLKTEEETAPWEIPIRRESVEDVLGRVRKSIFEKRASELGITFQEVEQLFESPPTSAEERTNKWFKSLVEREQRKKETLDRQRDEYLAEDLKECTFKPKLKVPGGIKASYLDYEKKQEKEKKDPKLKYPEPPLDQECTFKPTMGKKSSERRAP